jgi:hypothetical protein
VEGGITGLFFERLDYLSGYATLRRVKSVAERG